MKKRLIVPFATTSVLIIVFSVCLFMIMLPQSVNIENVDSYVDIEKEDFEFKNSKNISDENLFYQYNVTGEDIENFKNTQKYKAGNENPFYNGN